MEDGWVGGWHGGWWEVVGGCRRFGSVPRPVSSFSRTLPHSRFSPTLSPSLTVPRPHSHSTPHPPSRRWVATAMTVMTTAPTTTGVSRTTPRLRSMRGTHRTTLPSPWQPPPYHHHAPTTYHTTMYCHHAPTIHPPPNRPISLPTCQYVTFDTGAAYPLPPPTHHHIPHHLAFTTCTTAHQPHHPTNPTANNPTYTSRTIMPPTPSTPPIPPTPPTPPTPSTPLTPQRPERGVIFLILLRGVGVGVGFGWL